MPAVVSQMLMPQWVYLPHLNRDGLTMLYQLWPVCTCPEETVDLIAAPLPPIQRTLCHVNKNPAFHHTPSHMTSWVN